MDKNTVIGLLLITAIIIGFTIYNRPSQEQIEQQQRMRDSIAMEEALRNQLQVESLGTLDDTAASALEETNGVKDFFSVGSTSAVVSESDSPSGSELIVDNDSLVIQSQTLPLTQQTVVLENEHVRLLLDTRGGYYRFSATQRIPSPLWR